ncbi:MAG: DUF2007 domain-containing protein [Pedobacter sp.]|nr:MAG: DUF2007 domain-containing protein [Pedobacter sp.]
MNSTWVKVYTTENEYEAEIIKQSLVENDIPAVVLNKHDSAYKVFGVSAVMVHPDNFDQAIAFISQTEG